MIDEKADIKSIGVSFCGLDKEYEPSASEMTELRELIAATRKVKKTYFPPEPGSPQWDVDYIIEVNYTNGKKEKYYVTEANETVYKYLTSKSQHGNGYMLGTNEKLCSYLRKIYSRK